MNSGTRTPRIELADMGFSCKMTIRRHKLAADDLAKLANKQPKEIKVRFSCACLLMPTFVQVTKRKNESRDVFGSELGRIHTGKQNIDALQVRKHKAFKVLKRQQQEQSDDEGMEQ